MSAQWTLRPSNVLESLESGLKLPSLKSQTNSATNGRTRFSKTGDFFTIRLASDQVILAWSRLVLCVAMSLSPARNRRDGLSTAMHRAGLGSTSSTATIQRYRAFVLKLLRRICLSRLRERLN